MDEFFLIWSESKQKWIVLFADGRMLNYGYGSCGEAEIVAMKHANEITKKERGQAGWEITENTGTFLRYEAAA